MAEEREAKNPVQSAERIFQVMYQCILYFTGNVC